MEIHNLKRWTLDFNRLLFVRKKDQAGVPMEYYEDYKGHYNNPTDKLLDALFELLTN